MRGKRASTPGRLLREEVYCLVRSTLTETSKDRLNLLCDRLAILATKSECPKRMRMLVRYFLRRLPEFRNYLEYPELKLPRTTNVMESVNSFVRRKVGTINTPSAWLRWAIATIRLKSIFTCK